MSKCDYYSEQYEIIGWSGPYEKIQKLRFRCNGTRERDECTCGGDRSKCDFYPDVRKKASAKSTKSVDKMVWNVMLFDYNQGKTVPYNVFNNSTFSSDVAKLLSSQHHRGFISAELDRMAMYSFWGRCEYEFIASDWPPSGREEKVDVYSQLKMNWDRFVDYVICYKVNQ